jgi:hypothetical protein
MTSPSTCAITRVGATYSSCVALCSPSASSMVPHTSFLSLTDGIFTGVGADRAYGKSRSTDIRAACASPTRHPPVWNGRNGASSAGRCVKISFAHLAHTDDDPSGLASPDFPLRSARSASSRACLPSLRISSRPTLRSFVSSPARLPSARSFVAASNSTAASSRPQCGRYTIATAPSGPPRRHHRVTASPY